MTFGCALCSSKLSWFLYVKLLAMRPSRLL